METVRFYCQECWSLIKTMVQLMRGIWWLGKMKHPIITIFGGSDLSAHATYFKMAHTLAHRLAESNISIITGGGTGIMEAANCGVQHVIRQQHTKDIRSIGILVRGLPERPNICAQKQIYVDAFWARKFLMAQYAVSFAIFPGGFGTLDELGEILTLMKTKKLTGAPIVLLGVDYWQPFIAWLTDYALRDGLITQQDLALIQLTDDIDQAILWLEAQCAACRI